MLSTPKTDSSALHPAQTKNQTPTHLLQQRAAQSSQTLLLTLITTQYGGKVSTRIRPKTLSSGKVSPGTVRKAKKKAHIPTAVSQLPQRTAPASAPSLKIPKAFRFQHLFSAADAQLSLLLYTSQETGITVYSLVQSWLQKQQQQQQAQLA